MNPKTGPSPALEVAWVFPHLAQSFVALIAELPASAPCRRRDSHGITYPKSVPWRPGIDSAWPPYPRSASFFCTFDVLRLVLCMLHHHHHHPPLTKPRFGLQAGNASCFSVSRSPAYQLLDSLIARHAILATPWRQYSQPIDGSRPPRAGGGQSTW